MVKLEELTRDECLHLLMHKAPVGRLGFIVDGRPAILPVNFLAHEDCIVFCTAPGTKLSAVGDGADVVFETDANSLLYDGGWSVIVRGTSREITDPRELEKLRREPLHSWAVPSPEHWVRISFTEITGRRIKTG